MVFNATFNYISVISWRSVLLVKQNGAVILKSARDRPEQPWTARVLEITPVVLEYCLNRFFFEIIMEYDVK